MGRGRIDPTRALQAGFLVLLAICAAQVVFWILDEVRHTQQANDRVLAALKDDVAVAGKLVERGMDPMDVDRMFPKLIFSSGPERITINPQTLHELEAERRSRIARYGWEGTFFLIVLVAAMGVLAQALYQDAQLRRRQQNFLAAVTHEFKSPLASLRLSAETLALRDPAPPVRQRLMQRLLDDVGRLEAMISNLLDTAKLDEGKVALRPERVSLSSAVRALVEEVGERARAANVQLETRVPDDMDVEADPVAVRTVLRNLVDNAIKATAAKGGGLVRIAAETVDGEARLTVLDDGIGFPPAEGPRLFDKFYRPGDELRRTSPGSGLGLYIVRRFVQLTGGSVAARSEGPGRGALFTVTWPVPRRT
jgi:signal transduction histidine kinase